MSKVPRKPLSGYFTALSCVAIIVAYFWGDIEPRYTIGFDLNNEQCLPGLHAALLDHKPPDNVQEGALVFWQARRMLSYVTQQFVMKQVAGVQGDHLVIRDSKVLINDKTVVEGFPLTAYYRKRPSQLERDEIIPKDKVFVVGTHPNSDDSRYWGYLDIKEIAGIGHKIF